MQVEHTVTEEVTGIDIVQAQILIDEGKTLAEATGVASQADVKLNGHALQCRVTTEDPQNNFIPDYGRLTAYRSATGKASVWMAAPPMRAAVITRYYDLPAGQGHRPRADAGKGDRPHGPGLARIPHPGRRDEHRIRHQPAEAPDLPERHLHHQVHRHDARRCSPSRSAATGRPRS